MWMPQKFYQIWRPFSRIIGVPGHIFFIMIYFLDIDFTVRFLQLWRFVGHLPSHGDPIRSTSWITGPSCREFACQQMTAVMDLDICFWLRTLSFCLQLNLLCYLYLKNSAIFSTSSVSKAQHGCIDCLALMICAELQALQSSKDSDWSKPSVVGKDTVLIGLLFSNRKSAWSCALIIIGCVLLHSLKCRRYCGRGFCPCLYNSEADVWWACWYSTANRAIVATFISSLHGKCPH